MAFCLSLCLALLPRGHVWCISTQLSHFRSVSHLQPFCRGGRACCVRACVRAWVYACVLAYVPCAREQAAPHCSPATLYFSFPLQTRSLTGLNLPSELSSLAMQPWDPLLSASSGIVLGVELRFCRLRLRGKRFSGGPSPQPKGSPFSAYPSVLVCVYTGRQPRRSSLAWSNILLESSHHALRTQNCRRKDLGYP